MNSQNITPLATTFLYTKMFSLFNKQATPTSASITSPPPPTVTVVGMGILGPLIVAELASCFALQGGRVLAFDAFKTVEETRASVLKAIDSRVPEAYKMRVIEAINKTAVFPATLQQAVAGSCLIIECIIENPAAKQSLFKAIEEFADSNAVFATNTLTLRLSDIASGIQNPRRLIGLRFLYPVVFIPFVEITSASNTLKNGEAADAAAAFMRSLHKIAFVFNMDELWEGEQEAHNLMARRGFGLESLAERHNRMELVGAIRYRLQDQDATTHMSREARVRYDGLMSLEQHEACVVCLSNPPQVLIPSCGHMVICKECCKGIQDAGGSACPVCRARMTQALFVVPRLEGE